MKKIITLLAVLVCAFAFAQEKQIELNCYNKWAAKFEDRGAEEVKDGIYEDVIITTRQGSRASCNNGKAEVRKGKVVHFYVLLSDGSHEEVFKSWKDKSNENITINNGISKSLITIHNELVNILWPNSLKAKKAKPVSAADPTDD
jgi:hypothetical protein